MLAGSTTASIKDMGNKLKAGCSTAPLRFVPVGIMDYWFRRSLAGKFREAGNEVSPRNESVDDSSLFFIVRSFPSRLDFEDRYYDLC